MTDVSVMLIDHWCDIIVLNVLAPTDHNYDQIKDRFYMELERVLDQFPKHHTNILLGDFNKKIRWEDIFKPIMWDESLQETSICSGVLVANVATSKQPVAKSTVFPYRRIRKYTSTVPGGKAHRLTKP
jgi:hypothetical protein